MEETGEVQTALLDEQNQSFQIMMSHLVLVDQKELVSWLRMIPCQGRSQTKIMTEVMSMVNFSS